MKLFVSALFFFCSLSFHTFSQTDPCKLVQKTEALFRKYHMAPLSYGTPVYHEVLDLYIDEVDPDRLIFSLADSVLLHKNTASATSLCDVYKLTKAHIQKRVKTHDSLLKSFTLPYFTAVAPVEELSLPCIGKHAYQSDDKAVKAYVKKYCKYVFLNKLFQLKEANLVMDDQKVLNAIIQKRSAHVTEMISNERAQLNLFLKAVSLRYDPHSAFFDSSEKQEWVSNLSQEEFSFGFDIEITEDELYKVSEIIPGGSAWNSRQLEVGDIIDLIELDGGKKYLAGIDSDKDFFEAMQLPGNRSLTFHFTKADRTKRKIRLTKTKVEILDNVINGYIIQKGAQKMGYIELPSFYATHPGLGGNGCASDLAREITQLKKDGVNGLVIDLRNNGGGYMQEALSMAGLFIDEGVLALKQEKGDKPRYLKDPTRGILYDGKVIILVNQFSASASELLSGTLQQYNRAIIVGGRTYGKATMQIIVPLDSLAETQNKNSYYGNITMGKFYMVNKKTHQGVGIKPDIFLPGLFDYFQVGREADLPYYLKPDSVNKAVELRLNAPIVLKEIRQKSEERVKAGQWTDKYSSLADSLLFYMCKPKIELSKKFIFTWRTAQLNFFKQKMESAVVPFQPYAITNTSVYNQFLKEHEFYQKPNDFKIDELKKDIQLFETINILSDYLNQP